MTMNCREAVRRMWAYLERALEEPRALELDAHLETCKRCCGELEFARHLRKLVAESERLESMPSELRARIELVLTGGLSADSRGGSGR